MHVIYSDTIKGAGLITGGPFADNNGARWNISPRYIAKANDLYSIDKIDNP